MIENQRSLLEWLKDEERRFIDLKEIRAITDKYSGNQDKKGLGNVPYHQIQMASNNEFHIQVMLLKKYITYFEDIMKRHLSILKAFEVLKGLEQEYQELRKKYHANQEEISAEKKVKLQYIDQTKKNLQEERSQILTDCRVDLAHVMTRIEQCLGNLYGQIYS